MKRASLLFGFALVLSIGTMAQRNQPIRSTSNPVKNRKALIEETSVKVTETVQTGTTPKTLLSGYYMESFEGTFPPAGWSKLMPYTNNATGWRQCANGTSPLYGMWAGTQTVPPMGGQKVAFCSYLTGYNDFGYDQYLVTPQFSVVASDSLKFSLFRFGEYQDTMEVMVSTTANDIASFSSIYTIDLASTINNDWKQFAIDLTPYAGQNIFIAFREHVLNDDTNETVGAYYALDRVTMGNIGSLIDVASSSIDINGKNLQATIAPMATFFNEGGGDQTFDVTMTINPGNYSSTKTVTNIAPGNTQQITFDPWDANQLGGNYTVKIFTSFAGDQNQANDTTTKQIEIVNFQNKAFVFVAYDFSSPMIPLRTAIYDLADSSKYWVLNENFDVDNYPTIMGGAWVNKHWYATNANGEFAEIDTLSGEITIIGSLGALIRDLAYDDLTGTLYGITQGFGMGSSQLYSINTTTGAATYIAECSQAGFNTLACKQGVLYATNEETDSFYTIDKNTGASTKIGELGFNSNSYAQGLDFDPNGNLFMSSVNEIDTNTINGELRVINQANGSANLLHQFTGGYGYANNITGFVIPGNSWQEGLSVRNDERSNTLVTIFPNPAQDHIYLISPDQILRYKIMSISGQLVKQEETSNSTVSVNTSDLNNGFYLVQVETKSGILVKKINIAR